jgi:prefoldin subunit 5
MSNNTKRSSRKPEDMIRELDFLKYKVKSLQKDVRRLEYDNATLQRTAQRQSNARRKQWK